MVITIFVTDNVSRLCQTSFDFRLLEEPFVSSRTLIVPLLLLITTN